MSTDFPADTVGTSDFDNQANVLSASSQLVGKYYAAAEILATAAIGPAYSRILNCATENDTCARGFIRSFGAQAFRRPLSEEEVNDLFAVFTTGKADGFKNGIKLVVKSALMSPNFLFKVVLGEGTPDAEGKKPLTHHELATRLSYFLWAAPPDATLSQKADAGLLQNEAELDAQIARMLADPKAASLSQDFALQWLRINNLEGVNIDTTVFPTATREMKLDMLRETQFVVREMLARDMPLKTVFNGNFTFLNQRLATHYGVAGTFSTEFVKVNLSQERVGVISQGSVMMASSGSPIRTAPVNRGLWMMKTLLCTERILLRTTFRNFPKRMRKEIL